MPQEHTSKINVGVCANQCLELQQPIEQIYAQYIFSDMLKYAMAFRQTFLRTKFAAHWLPKINTFSKIFA